MSDNRPGCQQELPHNLEELPPGAQLAAVLASVDRRLLDERDQVRLLQARHRMVAHLQGELYADLYGIQWGSLPAEDNPAVPGHSPGCRLIQPSGGGRFGWITPKGMRYIKTADPPLYDDLDIIDP